ncbi:hypothetical protein Tco_0723299, partial [Tanacetum coccineum]
MDKTQSVIIQNATFLEILAAYRLDMLRKGLQSSKRNTKTQYSHVIGFGIIRGYLYVYIIAWRPASLGCGLLQTPGSRLTGGSTGITRPEYPEYLALSDEEVLVEDQPYAVADSPIALSLGYVADSDPEEDCEDGPVDYPADGGDGDDDDSSDDDEEEEEASKEEEEHLAPTDSVVAPVVDHVPSFEEIEPFETDESA